MRLFVYKMIVKLSILYCKPSERAILDTPSRQNLQAKVVRRGSVKELSEKFIQKESASEKTTTTSAYPKAGLILRSQVSRESTPGMLLKYILYSSIYSEVY